MMEIVITCDGCGKRSKHKQYPQHKAHGLREQLAKVGWVVDKQEDFCPVCFQGKRQWEWESRREKCKI